MTFLQLANQIGLFFSSTTHCELAFIVSMPQSGCFIIQLPRRVLRVYLRVSFVGVLTRERVSGACFRSKLPRVYRPLCRSQTFLALSSCNTNVALADNVYFWMCFHLSKIKFECCNCAGKRAFAFEFFIHFSVKIFP